MVVPESSFVYQHCRLTVSFYLNAETPGIIEGTDKIWDQRLYIEFAFGCFGHHSNRKSKVDVAVFVHPCAL